MQPEFPASPVTAARKYLADMLHKKLITLDEYRDACKELDR